MSLRSIPDWLYGGPEMKIPCDAYRMVWIGADGSVRLCYVSFELGNLHEQRLSEMLFGEAHRDASRGAFLLKCPNCHCERDNRVVKHGPSRRRYGS
jgi:cyclic pyranopterin phosphate synthase